MILIIWISKLTSCLLFALIFTAHNAHHMIIVDIQIFDAAYFMLKIGKK